MRTIIISLLMTICCLTSCRQTTGPADKQNATGCEVGNYQLFPTSNMWNFLKLDTRNGRIWQVQYDVSGNDRFEVDLSTMKRTNDGKETAGRFTLYQTQNMYNFILLDKENGSTWQVQWSTEPDNRVVIPISAN